MDTTTDLGPVLDRMRESQFHQGAELDKILEALEQIDAGQRYIARQQTAILEILKAMSKAKRLTPKAIFSEYLKPTGAIVMWWAPGVWAVQHIARGGDLQSALAMLFGPS